MAKFVGLVSSSVYSLGVAIIGLLVALTCNLCDAATYTVGGTPGWDISTDLDTWSADKTFYVGDVLSFQYSSSNSVEEVNKDGFDNCSTTNALQTFTNGNTSIPLTRPGPWYFIDGNRLYCLGGMKLQVNVESSQAGAPAAVPGGIPPPSSKTGNNPSIPGSSGFSIHAGKLQGRVVAIIGPLLLLILLCK